MSLNSVVNNLVRAAASIPADISDAELDRHVAALLAEEAKAREVRWTELGLGAWTDSPGSDSAQRRPNPNAPKPNKRFLASIIKNVDGHNRDLLKSQADAARDIRRARGEENVRGSSSKRISGGGRLFGGAMAGLSSNGPSRKGKERERERDGEWEGRYFAREGEYERGHSDRDRSNSRERGEHRRRDDEDRQRDRRRSERSWEGDERAWNRRSHRSRSMERDERHRRTQSKEDRDKRKRRERDRSSERDHDARDRIRDRSEDRSRRREKRREERYERFVDSEEDKPPDPHSNGHSRSNRHPPTKDSRPPPPPDETPPPSPSPSPPASRISKMDKYFNTTYDPRLDLGEVPKEGMIANVGWDNMLAVLKERGKKRRLHSPGLSPDPYDVPVGVSMRSPSLDVSERKVERAERRKRKEERKRRGGADSDDEDERNRRRERKRREKEREGHLTSAGPTNGDVMGMEYIKKGGTREWDKGK